MENEIRFLGDCSVDHRNRDHNLPEANAAWYSQLFFAWFFPIIRRVNKYGLSSPAQLHQPLPDDLSETLFAKAIKNWDKARKNNHGGPGWRLVKCLFDTLLNRHLFLVAFLGLLIVIFNILRAYFVSYVVGFLIGTTPTIATRAYVLGGTAVVLAFLMVLIMGYAYLHLWRYGMRVRVVIASLMFDKLLRLDFPTLSNVGSGQIVNLLSTDIETIVAALKYPFSLYDGPVAFILSFGLIMREVGLSALPGMGYMILFGVVGPLLLHPLIGKLRSKFANATDRRIQLMSEVIRHINVVKMYCWEQPFSRNIAQLRKRETGYLRPFLFLANAVFTLRVILPMTSAMLIIVTHSYRIGSLSASQCVRIIGLVEVAAERMGSVGELLVNLTACFKCVKRIEEFLLLEPLDNSKSRLLDVNVCDDLEVGLGLEKMTAVWNKVAQNKSEATAASVTSSFCLKDVKFRLSKGEMMTVIGPVGSGKTTLLMAMLGNVQLISGTINMEKSVAYVPQEPWIFSDTVAENILFGTPFNAKRYFRAIDACCLAEDMAGFPAGHQTIIGERGMTLSGGQKARISLARAVYQNKDIYLLDDPLSAVDAEVAEHIYRRCICGILSTKTRILVTHNLRFLEESPMIAVMNEGSVVAIGDYNEVKGHLQSVQSGKESDVPEPARARSIEKKSEVEGERSILSEQSEELSTGNVDIGVYKRYFVAGKGHYLIGPYLLSAVLMEAGTVLTFWWLSKWSKDASQVDMLGKYNQSNYSCVANFSARADEALTRDYYGIIYATLVVSSQVFLIANIGVLVFFSVFASSHLHNQLFKIVIGAPVQFFETTPVGIILNRFARDLGFIDLQLPTIWAHLSTFIFHLIGMLVLSVIVIPWMIPGVLVYLSVTVLIRRYALRSGRQFKRMEAVCKSPIYSHLSATINGHSVIRAFKKEDECFQKFMSLQNSHTSAWNMYLVISQWTALYIGLAASGLLTLLIIVAFVLHQTYNEVDRSLLGYAILYNSSMVYFLEFIIVRSIDMEIIMTSAERILLYSDLGQEKSPSDIMMRTSWPNWPTAGQIAFHNVRLKYSDNGPPVLKDISFNIAASQKVGITGRTGAGKSSLFRAMLRLTEAEGEILIDGLDIRHVPLDILRSSISVIPQDPVLFSGTLRQNLDPFEKHETCDIWQVLEQVQLKSFVRGLPEGLEAQTGFDGCRFSVGQKQLVCLARALLQNNKIIIVDEATANVDHRTDELVQRTIKEQFADATVMTIAHRMNTLSDVDQIMILDQGELKGFSPSGIPLKSSNKDNL